MGDPVASLAMVGMAAVGLGCAVVSEQPRRWLTTVAPMALMLVCMVDVCVTHTMPPALWAMLLLLAVVGPVVALRRSHASSGSRGHEGAMNTHRAMTLIVMAALVLMGHGASVGGAVDAVQHGGGHAPFPYAATIVAGAAAYAVYTARVFSVVARSSPLQSAPAGSLTSATLTRFSVLLVRIVRPFEVLCGTASLLMLGGMLA